MLKRVSIQNFKSLKDVTLDLQKVNLLIGPNNSGKSNFLNSFNFFSKINYQRNFIDLKSVSYKKQSNSLNSIFDFDIPLDDFDTYRYVNNFTLEEGYSIVKANQNFNDWLINTKHNSNKRVELNDNSINNEFRELFVNYTNALIFKPDPSKLLSEAKFSSQASTLSPDCSNLIQFYFYIDNNYKRKSAELIQRDLTLCVPEIKYFTLPPVRVGSEDYLGLRFFDKDDNGYWASEVSEGILYFLMLLCIVHQPNPPKLLLLEEPEKGIHPRRIEEIINLILTLAEEKDIQVIMTTHSPIVVDMFKDMPESVFIFDKDEDGATHVKNLQKDIIEPETTESERLGEDPPQYLNGLGQAWKVGLIGGIPR